MAAFDTDRVLKFEHRGAPQTVAAIVDGALRAQDDSRLGCRNLAEQICTQVTERDYVSEALAIMHFDEMRTRYFRDPRTVELVKSPEVIAAQIAAGGIPLLDCDDKAALIAGIGLAAGFSVRITCYAFDNAFFNNERQFSHVSAQLKDPRSSAWIVTDSVAGPNIKQMLNRVVAVRHWNIA